MIEFTESESDFAGYLREAGYKLPVQTLSGKWLAIQQMMYTCGLFLIDDGDAVGWRCSWCYESTTMAMMALFTWNGEGDDPPGPWVKQKGRNSLGRMVDRINPAMANPEIEF